MSNGRRATVDGVEHPVHPGERILELLARIEVKVPSICFHPTLGALETCDTCMVEANGELVRACSTEVAEGMRIRVMHEHALEARREAMQRILGNHELYCTI